jgi:hypothetical protein
MIGTGMTKIVIFSIIAGILISGCSSVVDVSKNNFETNYICDGKETTKQYYFVNRFNRAPSEIEKNKELLAAIQELNEQLQVELTNCQIILAKDIPTHLTLGAN